MQAATKLALEAPTSRVQSALRVVSSFPFVICALLVAKMVWGCASRIAEPDIWWHLGNAKYLLSNHTFPNFDTTCFTTAGAAWLNHEWLSELIYYAGFRSFGLFGLYLVAAIAHSALLVSVFCISLKRSGDPLAAAVLTEVGAVVGAVGVAPRTQVFGWLCFAAFFAIMLRFRSERRAPLWILPGLFCVWINLHGSWFFGLVVYAIFIAAGLVKRDIGRLQANPWSVADLKQLATTGLLSVAALFINPFGYRLVRFPFYLMFKVPLMAAYVQEFAPVNFHDELGKFVAIILAGIFFATFAGKKQWEIGDALLTAFAIYAALTHVRFLLLAGIILPPILVPQIGYISTYDPTRERRTLNLALLSLTAAFVIAVVPSSDKLQKQIDEWFPVEAMKFLDAHPQQGRMFNLDSWGGYLQWNVPQVQTFIDTRVDIFQDKGVLQDYLDATLIKKSPQAVLDRYQVAYVLYSVNYPLDIYLSNSPQWERIYADDKAVIYRRNRDWQVRASARSAKQE